MQQHRKTWVILALLCIGLVGCGANDDSAFDNNSKNQTIPIGYFSNEKHDQNRGNVTILKRDEDIGPQPMLNGNDNDGPQAVINGNDNDGPLIEMLDHSFGAEGNQNNNNQNNIQRNDNRVLENNRQGVNNQSNFDKPLIGTDDRNYHGHLANNRIPSGKTTYNRENEGELSSQINQRVENVENVKAAETIINDKNIVIGVLLEKNENVAQTKKNIENVIGSQLKDRQVQVFTNESQYNSIKVMNNDLKNGGPTADIEKELKNIVDIDSR